MFKPEKDLGSLGESELQKWCNQVGIVANKSSVDKTGWDFFLEFSTKTDAVIFPPDRNPSATRCWVQVKSTDTPKGNRKVNLKNWFLLVKNLYPAFFLALEFDGKKDCQRAYLVHIGETYIRKTLKRLRELGEDTTVELHKRRMSFDYGESEMLSSLNGDGLLEAIKSYVGDDPDAYSRHKSHLNDTVGYEEGESIHNYEVLIPEQFHKQEYVQDSKEFFVDFALGWIPHVDVVETEIYERRFDIIDPKSRRTVNGGVLQIREMDFGEGTLRFRMPGTEKFLQLRVVSRIPQGVTHLLGREYKKYLKILFEAPFINLILWPHKKQSDWRVFHPMSNEVYSLDALKVYSDLILLFSSDTDPKKTFEVEIMMDAASFLTHEINFEFDQKHTETARLIRDAWEISRYFFTLGVLKIKLPHLHSQRKQLETFASLLRSEKMVSRLFWTSKKSETQVQCKAEIFEVVLDGYRFVCGVALVGKPVLIETDSNGNHKYQLDTKDVRLMRKYCPRIGEALPYSVDKMKEQMISECQQKL